MDPEKRTRYFYDTEFVEDGPHSPIKLLSIGIVCEDGREYYAEHLTNIFFAERFANQFVRDNVLPHLTQIPIPEGKRYPDPLWTDGARLETPLRNEHELRDEVRSFCDVEKYGKPEFWGYYSAYDHVVLCQIFGAMVNLPKDWPMYTRDIKQLADQLGNPQLPPQETTKHHALNDARWTMECWKFLTNLRAEKTIALDELPADLRKVIEDNRWC
jgi:hypothetical protein